MTRIGTGYVDIQPDLSGFQAAVKRQLAGIDSDFRRVGQSAGTSFAGGFGGSRASKDIDGMRASLGAFEQDLKRSRAAVADTAGSVNLFGRDGRSSFSSIGDSAKRASAELQKTYTTITRQNIAPALRESATEAKRVEQNVGAITRAGRGILEIDSSLKQLSRSFRDAGSAGRDGGGGARTAQAGASGAGAAAAGATATLGGFRIALMGLIPAALGFGGAIASVVAALGPLIGLAAAGGNAFAAFGQGLGVFTLASMGVKDALKEQIDNQTKTAKSAIDTAAQQRSAARAVQSAQDGVRTASQGVTEAHRAQREALAALAPAISDARKRLTDLRGAAYDSSLSLKAAQQAADEASKALADMLRGPSPRALAEAHRTVTDALRGEDRAAVELADAHKALNDLFKPADALDVADAHDAITDAIRAQERADIDLKDQTLKLAKVMGDPLSTDQDRARAALDLADAQNAVGDAERNTARAKQRLAELEAPPDQDAVAAARRRVGDAEVAVYDAAYGTAEAREALAKLEQPADSADVARARLEVAQADAAVEKATIDASRATRDLADAEAKGISKAKGVVDARNAIREANLRVTEAEINAKRATQALADAQLAQKESAQKASLASEDLNKKLNQLPPAAQAFVKQLVAMKPRLDDLRQTAAQGFFPGVTEGLKAAMGNFDSFNKVLGETAEVLGEGARKSGELVGSPAFGRDIEIIGHRNAVVIDTLGEAMRHVVTAIRNVMVAAGPLTQWLADTINKWALQAASAAKAGRETGKLADFFEKTRAVMERLGSIIGHVASGLLGVGKAGQQSGNDILASIDAAARRFDEWANSVGGRQEIREFFEKTKELAGGLTQVLAGVTSGVTLMTLKVLPLAQALKLLGPYADEATVAFIAFKAATTGWAGVAAVATFATTGWVTAFWGLNAALVALTSPVALVVAAVAGLIAIGYLLIKNWDAVKSALGSTWGWLKQAASDTFGWITQAVRNAWEIIRADTAMRWGFIRDLLVGIWNAMRSTVTTVFGAIGSFIGSVWSGIRDTAVAAWGGIRDAASFAWNGIKDAVLTPIRAARDILSDIWGAIRDTAESAWGKLTDGVGKFASTIGNTVSDVFEGVANTVIDFINDIISAINAIPGVPNIDKLHHVGEQGRRDAAKKGAGKGGPSGTGHLARGGAFGVTGGMVNAPMVMMGEQAPSHPEFVIPTNPAYRDRAIELLAQAAGVIGFAEGGILGKITGAVGGLVGKLPGLGGLPDWLKGTGKWVLEHVADWIGNAVKSVGSAVGIGGGGGGGGTSGANQRLGRQMMLAAGWGEDQWPALRALWQGESGWNVNAVNPSSGAGGIPQALPASKMGAGWQGNARQQIAWGLGYIRSVYGSPSRALAMWQSRSPHWYAKGGIIPPYGGSFAQGGIVPGPVGAPRIIQAHGGERVVRNGTGPLVTVQQLIVQDPSDINTIAARLAWLTS